MVCRPALSGSPQTNAQHIHPMTLAVARTVKDESRAMTSSSTTPEFASLLSDQAHLSARPAWPWPWLSPSAKEWTLTRRNSMFFVVVFVFVLFLFQLLTHVCGIKSTAGPHSSRVGLKSRIRAPLSLQAPSSRSRFRGLDPRQHWGMRSCQKVSVRAFEVGAESGHQRGLDGLGERFAKSSGRFRKGSAMDFAREAWGTSNLFGCSG